MIIRQYEPEDCRELAELFYDTVHTVNAKDYTKEQLDVWADGNVNLEAWNKSFLAHFSVVAVEHEPEPSAGTCGQVAGETGGKRGTLIVGFGDIDETGYLDRLYVHKDYQEQGVATAICNVLEAAAGGAITTHASITARSFFENRGYTLINEQEVKRHGVLLTNFVMKK